MAIISALDSTEIGKLGEIAYIGLNAWAVHVDQHLEKRQMKAWRPVSTAALL